MLTSKCSSVSTTVICTDSYEVYPKVKYQPAMSQWMALMSGALIFVPGGMSLAFGLGWNMHTHVQTTKHLQFCWFIAFIVGAAVSAPLVKILPKRFFMQVSAALVIIGGIIFTSEPYLYAALVTARYLNGFATGFATVVFLIHASEIAANANRDFCLWLEQNSITVGIVIQVVHTSQWSPSLPFAADRVHGIFAIAFGALAYVCVPFIVESPVYHIRRCDDTSALNCLRQLQPPPNVSEATLQQLLDEQKSYVTATETFGWRDNLLRSPLLRMALYRSVLAFGFSLPLSNAMMTASVLVMGEYSWPPVIFAILRVGGTVSSLFMLDVTGRKWVALVALLSTSALSIAIACEFADKLSVYNEHSMAVICVLSQVFQYFAGLFAPSSSLYLSEAFPLQLKPHFLASCLVVQQTIHIIVICTFDFDAYSMFAYSLSVGVLMFVFFAAFCVTLPETRKTSLEEARSRFKHWLHVKCY